MLIDKPNIIDFVTDPTLLALSFSEAQETLLRTIYGLPLTDSQREIYRLCTGRADYHHHDFAEVTVIAGARSGKDSRIATPIASYEATLGDHHHNLARGERAVIPLVAQDTHGSRIAYGYLRSHFTDSRYSGAGLMSHSQMRSGLKIASR